MVSEAHRELIHDAYEAGDRVDRLLVHPLLNEPAAVEVHQRLVEVRAWLAILQRGDLPEGPP